MQNRSINPNKGPLSLSAFYKGNDSLLVLLKYLEMLPYQRISDPQNLSLIIFENCGTCSSKHAFLMVVAEEQGWEDFELTLCMYKMHARNTLGIGSGLIENGLSYLPEAHCYMKCAEGNIDITRPGAAIAHIREDILLEQKMEPEQIGEWKKKFHRAFIAEWLEKEEMELGLEEVWSIREDCIRGIQEYQQMEKKDFSIQ